MVGCPNLEARVSELGQHPQLWQVVWINRIVYTNRWLRFPIFLFHLDDGSNCTPGNPLNAR